MTSQYFPKSSDLSLVSRSLLKIEIKCSALIDSLSHPSLPGNTLYVVFVIFYWAFPSARIASK